MYAVVVYHPIVGETPAWRIYRFAAIPKASHLTASIHIENSI